MAPSNKGKLPAFVATLENCQLASAAHSDLRYFIRRQHNMKLKVLAGPAHHDRKVGCAKESMPAYAV
jgi:hypothetical protein